MSFHYRKKLMLIGSFFDINRYLCGRFGFHIAIQTNEIKRESGENPEQSRCCETP